MIISKATRHGIRGAYYYYYEIINGKQHPKALFSHIAVLEKLTKLFGEMK